MKKINNLKKILMKTLMKNKFKYVQKKELFESS